MKLQNFSDFFHKLQQLKDLKSRQIIFTGITFVLNWAINDPNGLKMRFFKYYQKPMHEPLIFYMELQQHKDLN